MSHEIKRVTRSKAAARANYDRLSRWYDILEGSSEWKFVKQGLELLDPKPGERILEVGFGTGKGIQYLAEKVGDAGQVTGIDLSDGMQRVAKERIEKAGLQDRVGLYVGDANQLPFEENAFDAVFTSFALELFDTPEIPVVLGEIRRVLRGRARVGVVSLSKTEPPGKAINIYEWFHDRFPTIVDCRPIFVQNMVKTAGFKVQKRVQTKMWGLPVEIVVATK